MTLNRYWWLVYGVASVFPLAVFVISVAASEWTLAMATAASYAVSTSFWMLATLALWWMARDDE